MSGAAGAKANASDRFLPLFLFGGLGVMGVLAYGGLVLLTKGDFDATGEIVGRETAHGSFSLPGGACEISREGGGGFRIEREDGSGLRVEGSGAAAVIRLDVPGSCSAGACKALELTAARCTTFDVQLQETSSTYNKQRVHRGGVKLRCELQPGAVAGELRFEKCVR